MVEDLNLFKRVLASVSKTTFKTKIHSFSPYFSQKTLILSDSRGVPIICILFLGFVIASRGSNKHWFGITTSEELNKIKCLLGVKSWCYQLEICHYLYHIIMQRVKSTLFKQQTTDCYCLQADKPRWDVGRTREEFVSYEPQANSSQVWHNKPQLIDQSERAH